MPNLKAYDPAFGYEMAVIVREGIRRMYELQEDVFYYITMMNEFYLMPPMPEGVQEGILKGMYRYKPAAGENAQAKVESPGQRHHPQRGGQGPGDAANASTASPPTSGA